jgi:hypothetical protein
LTSVFKFGGRELAALVSPANRTKFNAARLVPALDIAALSTKELQALRAIVGMKLVVIVALFFALLTPAAIWPGLGIIYFEVAVDWHQASGLGAQASSVTKRPFRWLAT